MLRMQPQQSGSNSANRGRGCRRGRARKGETMKTCVRNIEHADRILLADALRIGADLIEHDAELEDDDNNVREFIRRGTLVQDYADAIEAARHMSIIGRNK